MDLTLQSGFTYYKYWSALIIKRVWNLSLMWFLSVSTVICMGENQASRVRTTRSYVCGAGSGG